MSVAQFHYLEKAGLFRFFPEDAVERILKISYTRQYDEGQLLYSIGDESKTLFGVMEGAIKILSESPQGKLYLYGLALPGQWIGEVSALDGRERAQTCIAAESSEVFCIDRKPLLDIMEESPILYKYFVRVFCSRLRLAREFIEESVFLSANMRLAHQLLRFTRHSGKQSLKLSQEDLAASIGVSRQSIYRTLLEFQQQGWIEQRYGAIEVKNRNALEDYINAG